MSKKNLFSNVFPLYDFCQKYLMFLIVLNINLDYFSQKEFAKQNYEYKYN